jgi:hypothetical protein
MYQAADSYDINSALKKNADMQSIHKFSSANNKANLMNYKGYI